MSRRSIAAALFLPLACLACASPPTNTSFPRYGWYARAGPQLAITDFEADSGNKTPPVAPGVGLMVGALNDSGYDEAWGLEGGFEYSEHEMDEGVTGNYKRYLFGGRYIFNMDHKIRPGFTFGAAYHVIQMQHAESEFRTSGYGAYGGFGIDWQLTEDWALALDWKLHLAYMSNDFESDFVLWSIVGLWLTYYF